MGNDRHLSGSGRIGLYEGEIMKDKLIAAVTQAGNHMKQKVQEQDPKHLVIGIAAFALILVVAVVV